jgi:hypothetical protein
MSSGLGNSKRSAVIISIMMLIALAHIFRIGSHLQGELYKIYYSYFSDFVLTFGGYFLFILFVSNLPMPILRHWEVKIAVAFLVPSIMETCQYFGIPILGVTFDPLDYGMYAIGALSAAIVDTHVFARIFDFWKLEHDQT